MKKLTVALICALVALQDCKARSVDQIAIESQINEEDKENNDLESTEASASSKFKRLAPPGLPENIIQILGNGEYPSLDYGIKDQVLDSYIPPNYDSNKVPDVTYGPPGHQPPPVLSSYIPKALMTDTYYKHDNYDHAPVPPVSPIAVAGPPFKVQAEPVYYTGQRAPRIFKHVYVHVGPDESYPSKQIKVIKPKYPVADKHVQVIFVKAPSSSFNKETVVELPPASQQKTLVYVLTRKPNLQNQVKVIAPPKVKLPPPEVYFIRYAQNAHSAPIVKETYSHPAPILKEEYAPSVPIIEEEHGIGSIPVIKDEVGAPVIKEPYPQALPIIDNNYAHVSAPLHQTYTQVLEAADGHQGSGYGHEIAQIHPISHSAQSYIPASQPQLIYAPSMPHVYTSVPTVLHQHQKQYKRDLEGSSSVSSESLEPLTSQEDATSNSQSLEDALDDSS